VLDSALNRDLLGHTRPKNIQFTPAFAKTSYEASIKIHQTVKAYWQEHKERYFAP
jgi:ketopantoate hydroxymethyltransferase